MKSVPELVPAFSEFIGPKGGQNTKGRMIFIVYEEDWDPIMMFHWPSPDYPHLVCTHVDHLPPAKASGRQVIGVDFEVFYAR